MKKRIYIHKGIQRVYPRKKRKGGKKKKENEMKIDGTLRSRHGSLKPEVPRRREPNILLRVQKSIFVDYKIKKKPLCITL